MYRTYRMWHTTLSQYSQCQSVMIRKYMNLKSELSWNLYWETPSGEGYKGGLMGHVSYSAKEQARILSMDP